MTATVVDGVEVVASEPAESHLNKVHGKQYQRAEALAGQLERLVDSRNEWKARAQDAESALNGLRKALRGVQL